MTVKKRRTLDERLCMLFNFRDERGITAGKLKAAVDAILYPFENATVTEARSNFRAAAVLGKRRINQKFNL